ncbi:unnamed protein product [Alopecurus aequalis]
METKRSRAAAIAALCTVLILVLSGQRQQVAAISFCDCYQQCHPWCRHSTPWWLCNVDCAGKCDGGDKNDTLAACTMVCSTDSICGLSAVAPADADGVKECVRECNKRWGYN